MPIDRRASHTKAKRKSSDEPASSPRPPPSDARPPEHVRAAELFGGAYWLAQQIGEGALFAIGVTTHEQRLDLLRCAIRDHGLAAAKCPDFRNVKGATYAQAFALMFGVPFDLPA